MNSKVTTLAAGGCLLALLLGLAWFEHRSAGQADAALSVLAKRRAALDSAVRRMEERAAAADRDGGKLRSSRDMHRAQAITLPAAVKGDPPLDRAQLAAIDPKFDALLLKFIRAKLPGRLAGQYGSFYRSLGLAPDQIVKFEDLMVENYAEMVDIGAAASAQGFKSGAPEVAAAIQQQKDRFQSGLETLLGESGYQQLQDFNRAEPVGGIVNEVAYSAGLTASPLNGAQIDGLSQILARSSSSFQHGGAASPATIDWEMALAQAQGILSDPQLAALKGQYAQVQLNQMLAIFHGDLKSKIP